MQHFHVMLCLYGSAVQVHTLLESLKFSSHNENELV